MSLPPWRSKGRKPDGTAYTAVKARNIRNPQPSVATTAPPTSQASQSPQFPQSLKDYISRCYAEAHADDKEVMEKQLKNQITHAFETKTTWQIDWDRMMLPVIEERKQKMAAEQQLQAMAHNQQQLAMPAHQRTSKAVSTGAGVFAEPLKSPVHRVKKKKQSGTDSEGMEDYLSESRKQKRLKRFANGGTAKSHSPSPGIASPTPSLGPIVGRSTMLEKRYLRLTSEPDPELVRPEYILKQTVELLKSKWKDEHNYSYICDQFKSVRQDLTVQHIENEFTVQVYEIHARIALEKGDLGEYNQCQSRLKELYDKGISGNSREFLGYRILYLLHTQNTSEVSQLLTSLTDEDRKHDGVRHALRVVSSLLHKEYLTFFRLYVMAPYMGGYVMDSFVDRQRFAALSAICRAFRPTANVTSVSIDLGFEQVADFKTFLEDNSIGVLSDDGELLLTKESYPTVEAARLKAFSKVDIKGQI